MPTDVELSNLAVVSALYSRTLACFRVVSLPCRVTPLGNMLCLPATGLPNSHLVHVAHLGACCIADRCRTYVARLWEVVAVVCTNGVNVPVSLVVS